MNSMPASSAICARRRQSGQLPDQRSGTSVTARPEEQFAPNRPSLSLFALYIAARSPLPISRSIAASLDTRDFGHSLAEPRRVCQAFDDKWPTRLHHPTVGGDGMAKHGKNKERSYLYLGLAGETGRGRVGHSGLFRLADGDDERQPPQRGP